MPSLAQLCAGALAVVLVADHYAPPESPLGLRVHAGAAVPAATPHDVNRTGKGDRLKAVQPAAEQNSVATVEVIGLRKTGIVYRGEDGRVLFRIDPVGNATLVGKNVVLPEVTIRENYRSPVRTLPIDTNKAPVETNNAPAKPTPIPDGCDPAFSPLAVKANVTGRCIS